MVAYAMTSLHARTSKAAIVFALTVFTNLITTTPKSGFFGTLITEDTRGVALQNQGGNLTRAFDSLVDECVLALPSYKNKVSVNDWVHFGSHRDSTALLALPSSEAVDAKLVNKATVNALAKAKPADDGTTHNVLDVVLHAVYAMYAVLRHLIDTVYDLLNQPQNEAYEAKIMVRAIVTFAFQLFIKLFTTVLTRLKFKAADLVPRRVRVNTRILANVPQVRVNGASDGLGKMVLSALVVKRRLEDELSHVQNTILQGSQLVEVLVNSMGKSNAMAGVHNQEVLNTLNVLSEMQTSEAYIGSSKAVVNNIVNAATKLHVVDRKARNVNSKALVKQIVNQAKTLQEKLTGVSTKARFVSVPTELRDQVSLLVLHAQLLQ